MFVSIHSSAFEGVIPQLVGQEERTSTSEKPLPFIWFSNAFFIALLALMTFLTLLTATLSIYSGPSREDKSSQTFMGYPTVFTSLP